MHYDGEPNYCSENCMGPHYEDMAPECCAECGGNGRACWPVCTDRGSHLYEDWEGSTGAEELVSVLVRYAQVS